MTGWRIRFPTFPGCFPSRSTSSARPSLSGYLRMLLKERAGALTENQRRLLDEMERSCGRLSALLGEMSELGQLEDGRQSLVQAEVDLRGALREAVAGLPPAEDQAPMVLDDAAVADERLVLIGDGPRLRRTIGAILHALRREIIDGTKLVVRPSVRVHQSARAAWIALGPAATADALTAAEASTLVPFDEWRGGVGLALPLARRIIERHGGRLLALPGERQDAGAVIELPIA
jgi:signal transduction histidine kinase